ncbi:hypothetical protein AB0O51_26925 [Streptomyces sp. NPDC090301]|uniref:hypothetical protein n=1 Tax=Streptomyces sp. NPDC090301 TaxID=3154975 RepID=UPI00342549BE
MTEMDAVEPADEDGEQVSLEQLVARRQATGLPIPVQNPRKLPCDELDPEVFERLIAEIVSRGDHRGVQFYGRRGQKQYGLDIVALEPDRRRSLYQVKRYAKVTPALLQSAVTEYADAPRLPGHGLSKRRFDPYRFVVVTSAETEFDTAMVDALETLQKSYEGDLEIELWGVEEVGRRLRDAVGLVAAVFGETWARAWCGMAPTANGTAEPVPLGLVSAPVEVLELTELESRAHAVEKTDPAEAARLLAQLAQALDEGNFPGHAAQVRERQAASARAAGNPAEAFDLLFRLALSELVRGVPRGGLPRSTAAVAREAGTVQEAKWTALEAIACWYEQGSRLSQTVPALRTLVDAADPDSAELCCLVLEQALVDGLFDLPWLRSLVVDPDDAPASLLEELRDLAGQTDTSDVVIRARLACALADTALTLNSTVNDVQSAYGTPLSKAGAGRFGHGRGLIHSRAAYAFALHGDPEHAENLWRQAVLTSSEDRYFGDARHALRSVRRVTGDRGAIVFGLDRITRALPNDNRLLAGAADPALTSHTAVHHEQLPDAFADARRYLWESRLQGALQEEVLAMELFGDVLNSSGHPLEAVDAYIYAGAAKKAAEAAGRLSDVIDVEVWLRSPIRSRRSAAIQVIAAQSALIKDADVAQTAGALIAAAQGPWTTPAFRPHPQADAIKAVRGLAGRLPDSMVDSVLGLVEPALTRSIRYNDEAAALLVRILQVTENRRSELAAAISRMMVLPHQDGLWDQLAQLEAPHRDMLLAAVEVEAANGVPEALTVLQAWFPSGERAQRRARAACASLLREPVGVQRGYSRLDAGDGMTVGLLLDLLSCPEEELVDVAAADLGPEPSYPDASAGSAGDEAANTAAGPPADLAAAVVRQLTAMVEDGYDSASSRNSRALALTPLLDHIPPTLAYDIAHRLLAVHLNPRFSETDEWEIGSSVPLSRIRMDTGAAHLPDNALRAAAHAWASTREPDGPMNDGDRQFVLHAMRGAAALLRHSDAGARIRGARCVSSLAHGATELIAQAVGLALHGCEYVRAIAVTHVPHTDPLMTVLASDPAPRVRAAVARRAQELSDPVLQALASDPHAGVRRTLAATMS